MRKLFYICLMAFVGIARADNFADYTASGQQFGQSMSGYVQGIGSGTDSRASQYNGSSQMSASISPCSTANSSGQMTCGGAAENSAQDPSQFASMTAGQLTNQATQTAITDANAQFVIQAHGSRPNYTMSRKDPLFQNTDANTTNMTGLAQTYQGCTNIAYGTAGGQGQSQTCPATGSPNYQTFTCSTTITPYCSDGKQYNPGRTVTISLSWSATGSGHSGTCGVLGAYWTFNIEAGAVGWNPAYMNSCPEWSSGSMTYVSGGTVTQAELCAPGVVVTVAEWTGAGGTQISQQPGCTNNGVGQAYSYYQCRGCSSSGNITVTVQNIGAVQSCDMLYPQTSTCSNPIGTKASTACTQDGALVVNGFTLPAQCWAWTDTYENEVSTTMTPSTQCVALENQGCALKGTTCNQRDSAGNCVAETMNYQCNTASTQQTVQVCGSDLVCPGGQCDASLAPAAQGTQSFMQAATVLAMMQDMKSNFNASTATIWQGTYAQCSNSEILIGSNECCTGGTGFVNQLPGQTCDSNEQNIMAAKQALRVTQVGSYSQCVSKVLGVCIKRETYYQFCLWPSELARIVQDQGMPQLGQPITSSCAGFTLQNPDQLAQLNWSNIDLSEYFSQVAAQQSTVTPPNGSTLQTQTQSQAASMNQQFQQQMQQYYGQ